MRIVILSLLLISKVFPILASTYDTDSLNFEYPAINYSTKNGLPSNETYCVFQDSRGYIWTGTDRGIVKFDGYKFKTYTTLDGLTDNVILAINEDKEGNIWYSGLNNGLIGFIDTNMAFHKYKYQDDLSKEIGKLNGLHLNKIYIDDSDLYFANNKYGYVVLNNSGLKHSSFSNTNTSLPIKVEFKEYFSKSWHFIYSKTYKNNLKRVKFFDKEYSTKLDYSDEEVRQRYPTLLKHKNKRYIYDGYNKITFSNAGPIKEKLPNKCSAFRLGANQFLFSTYGKNEENSIVYLSNSPDFDQPKIKLIKGLRITEVIKDLKGGLWISSTRNGLYYFPNLNSKITTFKDPIEAILPIENGIIFSSINQHYCYKPIDGKITLAHSKTDINNINNTFGKISLFNFHVFNLQDSNHSSFTTDISGIQNFNSTKTLMWDKNDLYVFNETNGQNTLDRQTSIPYSGNPYCFNTDSCLIASPKGMYLLNNDKITKQNYAQNKSVRHVDYFPKQNVIIYSIWGEGLDLLFPDGKIVKLSDKDGLASNTINTIYLENDNLLWIGTNQGINTLSFTSTGDYQLKTILKGSKKLSSPNILQIYAKDSTLYLGTDAGLNIVDLKLKDVNPDIPLILEKIEINNVKLDGIPNNFTVDYDSNTINFHFTGLTYNMFGKVNYRFKLTGLSDLWIYSKDRKAKYLQLDPGKYKFEVEVKNEFDQWIPCKEQVSFTIKKPFWQTWWFISLISLGLISLIGGSLYYHISNLKREKLHIQKEKNLSEKLNQSRQKALNSQLNPHFVFNSLNSIQHYILTEKVELSSDYLGLFAKLMRFVFENSKKLYIPLEDEIQALQLYLSLERLRHDNAFEFKIDYDKFEASNINIPSLLIQPIVENAIWHGLLPKKEGEKRLNINFTIEQHLLRITVIDTGVGRKSNPSEKKIKVIQKQKSSGEKLTRDRLKLLQSAINQPTSFEISDILDHDGLPNGTKVEITIPNSLRV